MNQERVFGLWFFVVVIAVMIAVGMDNDPTKLDARVAASECEFADANNPACADREAVAHGGAEHDEASSDL